ncbi:MAG: prolipoprotein diacylglyceryl transferase [Ruminococcaceae bacterium]|nr:prolipoprotein diacylglyceryl transferase [Oscillospiraceae bacterium]
MYPYEILPGIDMYVICLSLAALSAIIIYRLLADRAKIGARLQNLCIFTAIGAIAFGYLSAVFFQAFYNIKKYGKFVINSSTGATFYGGLIGGALFFLLVYFLVGKKIFPDGRHKKSFFTIADIAACCIAIAHALGRVGCLMVGCCYGKETDAWYGIYMVDLEKKVIPTQLFEAIFLLILFAVFVLMVKNKMTYCLQIYLCAYGVWRFIIEYFRDDYRGTTIIEATTPSQLTAIFMVAAGILLIVLQRKLQTAGAVEVKADKDQDEEYEYAEDYEYDYGEKKEEDEQK